MPGEFGTAEWARWKASVWLDLAETAEGAGLPEQALRRFGYALDYERMAERLEREEREYLRARQRTGVMIS